MQRVQFLVRVGIGMALLLAIATMLGPAPRAKGSYPSALRSLDVATANAWTCFLGQVCIGNQFTGYCHNGHDPYIGCDLDTSDNLGCHGCAI
jgi:hypothetical protein